MTRLDLPGGDAFLICDVFEKPDQLFDEIVSGTDWRQEEITVFGRKYPMPRQTYWMGDVGYSYSGLRNYPQPLSQPVMQIRDTVQSLCETTFNGVLLNLYRNGRDSMGWHADDEASLGTQPVIASVNLGAARRLRFKPKPHADGAPFSMDLPHGSVLVMRGDTQKNWLHCVPKSAKTLAPRLNLTFRRINAEKLPG